MSQVVYAEVGSSTQQVGGSLPSGWTQMQGERPSPDHIAKEDGTWVLSPHKVEDLRKQAEAQGVIINGVRYAGSPDNRQAINEALDYAEHAQLTAFADWKDSDGNFHVSVPVADVHAALVQIGARRSELISLEKQYTEDVESGAVTDLNTLDWTTEFDISGEGQ